MAKKQSDTIHHRSARWKDDIHATPDVSYISNPDVAHEHTDVSVGPIARFVVGLVIFGLIVIGLVYGLFRYFDMREKSAEPQASPLARRGDERLPPEPRLQVAPGFGVHTDEGQFVDLSRLPDPHAEYREVLKEWDEELTTYGWADEATGAVRIPIEEAMRRYAEQQRTNPQVAPSPAPPQTPAQQQAQPPQHTPAEGPTQPAFSSSGQTHEKRDQ